MSNIRNRYYVNLILIYYFLIDRNFNVPNLKTITETLNNMVNFVPLSLLLCTI